MGTTSSGKQLWRCTHCGHTFTNPNTAKTSAYRFAIFIDWITGQRPLDAVAAAHNVSRRTLIRWFTYFWFIIVPCKPDPYRVYDQLFIDGTYFHKKCLLVAATSEHVVAWHWCTRETAYDYAKLFDLIAEPLVVTTDGSGGAHKAIKQCWPNASIQRCLVHVRRDTIKDTTRQPTITAHKALLRLGNQLTHITTRDQAITWVLRLNRFHDLYGDWLKQRTYRNQVAPEEIPKRIRDNQQWWYTHPRARRAYRRFERLYQQGHLFVWLNPPHRTTTELKTTTNSLEGGVNAQLKHLARAHRGAFDEHQRIIMDWWLYLHTQHHDDPLALAIEQDFGRKGYAHARQAHMRERDQANSPDGRPKVYDTGIDTDFNPSWAIRHGWAGRS